MDPLTFSLASDDYDILLLSLERLKKSKKTKEPLVWDLLEDDEICEFHFRFTKAELLRIKAAMALPSEMKCSNGTKFTDLEGLLITLRRFTYPCRLGDLCEIFGGSKSEMSMIVNTVLNTVLEKFGKLVTELDHYWLSQQHLEEFSAAIKAKGAPLDSCWGFIDGTIRGISRPEHNQQAVYNGHKRKHSIKFQSIVTPNGLVAHLFGPIEGRRHDCYLLSESKILLKIEQFHTQNGQPFYLYGDPAYPHRPQLQRPYRGAVITPQQSAFNKAMSEVRVSVEWEFGKVLRKFAFIDFTKNQKLYLQPVGKYYQFAILMTNIHTCMHGSQTSDFFGLDPPTLENYLNNTP